jgi:hypothetical protein
MRLLIAMNLSPRWVAMFECPDQIAAGALLTVNATRFRLTLLPLQPNA